MQLTLSCPIHSSYRVQQIAGMFDVPITERAERIIEFDSPPLDDPNWKIGCIVGPSGSGKSSIAKKVFSGLWRVARIVSSGECQVTSNEESSNKPLGTSHSQWEPNKAVIDCFGDHSVKDITAVLTLVGFSSPPSWIKPYSVLSNGEKFRCDLAKALLGGVASEEKVVSDEWLVASEESSNKPLGTNHSIVVFDEYTSVVDRNVAKIASAAIAKAIKSGKLKVRFVAVTCHYDVLDWLEPDWVLDTATGKCQKVFLRRPKIELEIYRCERSLWNMFKTHHYLSGTLAKSCRCYAAFLKEEKKEQSPEWNEGKFPSRLHRGLCSSLIPVAFCALIPQQGFERWYRVSRIVTLPDYQGVGIGSRFLDSLAEIYVQQNYRFSITASHPSVIGHCKRSPHWKAINIQKTGSKHSSGRCVVSFERK